MSLPEPRALADTLEYHPAKHYCASSNKTTGPKNAPLLKCSACKLTYYCERSCQKEDYKYHKHLCKKIVECIKTHPRTAEGYFVILKFPEKSSATELIWWSASHKDSNGDIFPGISSLENSESVVKWLRKQYPREKKHVLHHELQLYFRLKFLFDGSAKNQSIKKVFGSALGHDWRGDIHVARYGLTKNDEGANVLQDFHAADLRVLADCFQFYGKISDQQECSTVGSTWVFSNIPTLYPNPDARQAGTDNNAFEEYKGKLNAVVGVNVTSVGDQKYLNKPAFIPHRICASKHPIYRDVIEDLTPSTISIHLDLPLLVRKHGFFRQGWPAKTDPHANPNARFLHRAADSTDQDFGTANAIEWNKLIGTVLVVCQDKKAITPQQVEAFCLFCDKFWDDHIGETDAIYEQEFPPSHEFHADELMKLPGSKEVFSRTAFIMKYMQKENFEEFLQKLKAEKVLGGDMSWVDAESPYKV